MLHIHTHLIPSTSSSSFTIINEVFLLPNITSGSLILTIVSRYKSVGSVILSSSRSSVNGIKLSADGGMFTITFVTLMAAVAKQ